MGVDVLGVDWAVMRTGTDRNDTSYTATNLGHSQFVLPADAQLFDIESDYAPHTIEDMKAIVESIGLKWEDAITPPTLTYPTLQGALTHVMPNGKYKDQTFKQIWETDQSNKGMINYLATKSDRITAEKAAAQVILVNLGGATIPGVPKYNADGSIANAGAVASANYPTQTAQAATPAQVQTAAPAQVASPAPSGERTAKIDKINGIFASAKKYTEGGFKLIMETMKSAGSGKTNIGDFTDAELDALVSTLEGEVAAEGK